LYNEERPHGALRGLTPAKAAELARGTDDEHNTKPGLQS
jgi:transposase InsO family protein